MMSLLQLRICALEKALLVIAPQSGSGVLCDAADEILAYLIEDAEFGEDEAGDPDSDTKH